MEFNRPVDSRAVSADAVAWQLRRLWPDLGPGGSARLQGILVWPNKAGIAMGVRPLGKGKVITMGTPMPNAPNGWKELLTWCGVTVPTAFTAPGCRVAHFASNNGLYDVYVVSAEQIKEPGAVTLTIPGKQALLYIETTDNIIPGIFLNGRLMNRDFAGMHSLVIVSRLCRCSAALPTSPLPADDARKLRGRRPSGGRG